MISIANQIELRHLNYFKVLAEELHYRKASEKLFISQSALSQQMKKLETFLGVPLFERMNKKVALSDAGRLFYHDALQVLNKVDVAINNLSLLKSGNTGQIGIGFVASAMQSVLPTLLKKFNVKSPNIKLKLDELNNQEQIAALESEAIDLSFMRSNQVDSGYMIKSVYKENFSLVLPKQHWITEENFENIGQLRDEAFILFPNDQSQLYYQQIINLCSEHGFIPTIAHRSIHAPTIFKLVENGMGLSVVPTSLANEVHPGIRFIELKDAPQKTELYAVWKKMNRNPALPFLLELLG